MSASQIPRIDVDLASRDKLIDHIIHLENLLTDRNPPDQMVEALRQLAVLQPQEARILAVLLKGMICSRRQIRCVAGMPEDAEDEKVQVSVRIHSLRRKIQRFGVTIRNIYGAGYQIEQGDIQRLRSLLSGRAAA